MAFVNKGEGMTLIELLITIALIGIVAVTAIPNLTEWVPKGRLESDLNQLFSRLVFLRQRAVIEGRSYLLELDPTGSPPCVGGDPCFNTFANTAAAGCSRVGEDNVNVDSVPPGTALFATSPVLTPDFTPLAGCGLGTGICGYPTGGVCFDAAGNAVAETGIIDLALDGVTRYQIQVFPTGYLTKSRRRSADDPWLEF